MTARLELLGIPEDKPATKNTYKYNTGALREGVKAIQDENGITK
jgi:hypothetical protein